jgi:hypothetical protein
MKSFTFTPTGYYGPPSWVIEHSRFIHAKGALYHMYFNPNGRAVVIGLGDTLILQYGKLHHKRKEDTFILLRHRVRTTKEKSNV